jgi:hypothetical protein
MSLDMTRLDSFLDLGTTPPPPRHNSPKDKKIKNINGSFTVIPRYHLSH